MALSNSCHRCGSRDLNDSLLQDRGEVTCRDCGVEQKDYTNLDSSSPPRREGDDNRAKGPTTRQRPTLEIDDNVRYGDRVWNLPPLSAERKRGESKRKKEAREEIEGLSEDLKEIKNEISQIESKIDAKKIEYLENWLKELNALVDEEGLIEAHTMLIETLRNGLESDLDPSLIENMTRLSEKLSREEEVVELSSRIHNPDDGLERKKEWKERDLARLFAKIHRTGPPGKNEDWMFKHQARDFLRLGPKQGDEQLDRLVKELCPGINWVELVTEVISNPTLPDRAPEGDDMARMWTPRRERIGIEVFAYMTAEEGGFWFFSDYKRRLGLNDKNIERILKNGLPISSRVCLGCLGRISDRDSVNEAGFVSRCAILDGAQEHRLPLPEWFSNPPDELWNKLSLGVRGTGSGARLEDLRMQQWHHGDLLHYWIEPPRWKNPDATGKIHGIVRPHPDPLILRHIPLAYYAAQEFWSRRVPEWRPMCVWMLKMISKDLEWCGATAEEMDGWWDSMWAEHGDDTPSVTTLRH